MFDDKEKKLLKHLVEKEIKEFAEDEKTIRPPLDLLEAEEKYEIFLENLRKIA